MAKKERTQEDVQALLYQYQLLGSQAETLQKQSELLSESVEQLNTTIKSLEDLKDIKPQDEIMMPMGAGAFVRGTVTDSANVLFNIGANVIMKKDVNGAIQTLEKRKSDLESSTKRINEDLSKTQLALVALEPEIQKMLMQPKQ